MATVLKKQLTKRKKKPRLRTAMGGMFGLVAGLIAAYVFAYVERVTKPEPPLANFTVSVEGMRVQCQNSALGEGGWWDFGDGTALVPYDPAAGTVEHEYGQPGEYTIRLRVVNRQNTEHERQLAVSVKPSATQAIQPTISNFSVEPVGSTVAPALYHVRFRVTHAEQVILFNGVDRPPEVIVPTTELMERYVVYERPLQTGLQLYAVNSQSASMNWAAVRVEPARQGALSVVARIQDTGSILQFKPLKLLVPVRWSPGQPTVIERTIRPELGHRFVKAEATTPIKQAGAEVKLDVALDQLSAKLNVTMPFDSRGLLPATMTELIVPVELEQERETPLTDRVQVSAGQLAFQASPFGTAVMNANLVADVPLPPVPANVASLRRTIRLELYEMNSKPTLLQVFADVALPQQHTISLSNGQRRVLQCQPTQDGQAIRVTVLP